jgi:hypothetical protein
MVTRAMVECKQRHVPDPIYRAAPPSRLFNTLSGWLGVRA